MHRRSYCTKFRAVVMTLLIGAVCLIASAGWAANCGSGVKTCVCGDTLMTHYQLPANIGPCAGNGLIIGADNIDLGCQGRSITGSNPGADTTGLILNGRSGVDITECKVSGFRRGIEFQGNSHHNYVYWGSYNSNGVTNDNISRGIQIGGTSNNNTFKYLSVNYNKDEGIHFGSGTYSNWVEQCGVLDNSKEQIYMLNTSYNILISNTVRGGSNTYYIENSHNNGFQSNLLHNSTARWLNGSSGNLVLSDRFRNMQVRFTDGASSNTIDGAYFRNTNGVCVDFTNNPNNNVIQNSKFHGPFGTCLIDAQCQGGGVNYLTNNVGDDVIDQDPGCSIVVN